MGEVEGYLILSGLFFDFLMNIGNIPVELCYNSIGSSYKGR